MPVDYRRVLLERKRHDEEEETPVHLGRTGPRDWTFESPGSQTFGSAGLSPPTTVM